MSDFLYFIGMLLIFCILLWGNYGVFTSVVIKWTKKPKSGVKNGKKVLVQPNLNTQETLRSFIPGWQAVEVYKALHGSSGFLAPVVIVCCVGMFLNCLFSWFIPVPALVLVILHWWFLIGFLTMHIIYAFVTVECALLYDFGCLMLFLCAILPQVFCFYMKNNIPRIMKDLRKGDTFKENLNDTVIKDKVQA